MAEPRHAENVELPASGDEDPGAPSGINLGGPTMNDDDMANGGTAQAASASAVDSSVIISPEILSLIRSPRAEIVEPKMKVVGQPQATRTSSGASTQVDDRYKLKPIDIKRYWNPESATAACRSAMLELRRRLTDFQTGTPNWKYIIEATSKRGKVTIVDRTACV